MVHGLPNTDKYENHKTVSFRVVTKDDLFGETQDSRPLGGGLYPENGGPPPPFAEISSLRTSIGLLPLASWWKETLKLFVFIS